MDAKRKNEPTATNPTTMERTSDRELVITRLFNGPARIVFDVWTNADLVRRWWVPKSCGGHIVRCDADVRVGGSYRYVMALDRGVEVIFSGKYSEVTPHTRLVYTSIFEPHFDSPAVVTVTFEERDGKTFLTAREMYASKEVLDGAIASGMEGGMRESMDQLDEIVASLR